MGSPIGKKAFIKQELRELFRLRPGKRHWSIPLLAAACVGVPMIVGLIIDKFSSALTIGLAGLVILYMPTHSNVISRMAKMLICSFGFLVAYGIGVTFSFNPVISCLAFGVFSAIVHWISLSLRIAPPGDFFFIMLGALASGIPFNLEHIPERIGLVAMGTMLACFFALVYSLLTTKPNITNETKHALDEVYVKKDVDYVQAIIVGFFMFCSLIGGYLLELDNPYWIPISALAVMQGATAHHIWRRGFSRVMGTVLGMVLCWVVLSTIKSPLGICIMIVVLQFIVEATVLRNYALAVVFMTPLTILLAELGNPIAVPTQLILSRLIDVLIGSFLGAIGGWVVYHETLRYHAVRRMRITRLSLRRKQL